jgi:hypothetical protein
MGKIRIQDCADCNQPPTLTCDNKEGGHMYDIAHRCPDGTVARGARSFLRDEVIQEWNRQQVRRALTNEDKQ